MREVEVSHQNVTEIVELLRRESESPVKVFVASADLEFEMYQFQDCRNLLEIRFCSSYTGKILEEGCFKNCVNLRKVECPDSVTRILPSCFRGCSSLESVIFTEKSRLSQIDADCFHSCCNLKTFVCPDTVTTIGLRAFYGCTSLSTFDITKDSHLEEIMTSCFGKCNIRDFRITKYLNINGSDFTGILNIGDYDNPQGVFEKGFLMTGDRKKLFMYSGSDESVTIPAPVEFISHGSFYRKKGIKKVGFESGSNIKHIAKKSFIECSVDVIVVPPSAKQLTGLSNSIFKEIIMEDGNANIEVDQEFVYSCDNRIIVNFLGDNENITVPGFIEEIASKCFEKNHAIKTFDFDEDDCVLTTLGSGAFRESSIEEVALPSSLRLIEHACFEFCRNLKEVSLPEDVDLKCLPTSIFSGCSSLARFAIPRSVTEFGDCVFQGSGLTTVYIPESVERLGWACFMDCKNLSEVKFAENIKVLEMPLEFAMGATLKRITVPKSVHIIHDSCFQECEFLTEVVFEEESELTTIGELAFARSGLTNICFPEKLDSIGNWCFNACENLTDVRFAENSKIKSLDGEDVFINTTSVNLVIPKSVESINPKFITGISSVTVEDGNTHFRIDGDFLIQNGNNIASYIGHEPELVIPSNLTALREGLFAEKLSLEKVVFNDSVISWFPELLFHKSSLQSIQIPKSVKGIRYMCFRKCRDLTEVTFEEGSLLEVVSDQAFEKCGLKVITIPKSVRSIGARCFDFCTKLVSVEFEDNSELEEINECAFRGTKLTTISIPASVARIGKDCFGRCTLTQCTFGESETGLQLTEHVFDDLQEMVLPRNVDNVTGDFLRGIHDIKISQENPHLSSLGSMITNKDSTEILASSSLQYLLVPRCVKRIGRYSFAGMESLERVEFEDCGALETIGEGAFAGTSLKTVNIPKHVRSLEQDCFKDCKLLNEVIFADDCLVTKLNCLFGGAVVGHVYLPANISEVVKDSLRAVKDVTLSPRNNHIVKIGNFICNKENSLLTQIGTFHQAIVPVGITEIRDYFFDDKTLNEVSFELPSSVKHIGCRAMCNTAVTSICIPKSVESIGRGCFERDIWLSEVTFENGSRLKHIGGRAFFMAHIKSMELPKHVEFIGGAALNGVSEVTVAAGNTNVTTNAGLMYDSKGQSLIGWYGRRTDCDEFVVPNYITTIRKECFAAASWFNTFAADSESKLEVIEEEAFAESRLDTVIIPQSVTTIKQKCFIDANINNIIFSNCHRISILEELCFARSTIRSVNIPASVEIIKDKCFLEAEELAEVVFEPRSKLKIIGDEAFCKTGISCISFPSSLVKLGDRSFLECKLLTSATFPKDSELRYIGHEAFRLCPRLRNIEVNHQIFWIGRSALSDNCVLTGLAVDEFEELKSWSHNSGDEFHCHRENDFYKHPDFAFVAEELGSGAWGRVRLLRNRFTGEEFAVKELHMKDSNITQADREIDAMKVLGRHSSFVSLKGYIKGVSICMEYLKGGSLDKALELSPAWLTDTVKAKILVDIAFGMYFMHENHWIHRDLKPGNILLDENHHAKICDLGSSREDAAKVTMNVGTLLYMAPEVYTCDTYTDRVDVFSFGLIFYEIIEGHSVFSRELLPTEIISAASNNIRPAFKSSITNEACSLIQQCWSSDPSLRPTFTAIIDTLADMNYVVTENVDINEIMEYAVLKEKEHNNYIQSIN